MSTLPTPSFATSAASAQAVLVIDMCGFSLRMEEEGVSSALAAVAKLQAATGTAAERHGGRMVKCWADNVMAAFGTVRDARRAAEAVLALMPSAAGIGFGEVVDLGGDLFGVEVNRACRLGEDVAHRNEILLTDAAERQAERECIRGVSGGEGHGAP